MAEVRLQFRAEFWPLGGEPAACSIARNEKGDILCGGRIPDGTGQLMLCTSQGRRYLLGEYAIQDGVARKSTLFDLHKLSPVELDLMLDEHRVDQSATRRIHSCLQKMPDLMIELKLADGSVELTTQPLTKGGTSPFFLCRTSSIRLPDIIEGAPMVVYLFGVAYVFRAHIIDRDEQQLAVALPSATRRIARRAIAREAACLDVALELQSGRAQAKVVDFSHLGMCLTGQGLSELPIWAEVHLEICDNEGRACSMHGLVVAQSQRGTHLLLEGGTAERGYSLKARFYFFARHLDPTIKLEENPKESWDCLRDFGYLELSDKTALARIEGRCVSEWLRTAGSDLSFLPVAKGESGLIGTYGAFQGGVTQWIHHLLAIQFNPSALAKSATLYQAWPSYLASRAEATWLTAWYDPTKTWHNRFCQVFIKEHERHPECITFDRHWFWLPEIPSPPPGFTSEGLALEDIDTLSPEQGEEARATILERYSLSREVPILPLKGHDQHGEIKNQTRHYCILQKGQYVGSVMLSMSEWDLNPFSASNCAHINIVNPDVKADGLLMQCIIHLVLKTMTSLGFQRGAFTLDFDAEIEPIQAAGFTYFILARCLSFSSRLLSDWMSNNALSFADLKMRSGNG